MHEHIDYNNTAALSNMMLYAFGNWNFSERQVLNPAGLTNATSCPNFRYYWAPGYGCYPNLFMTTTLNSTLGLVSPAIVTL
jgi:hypothetical protein